MLSFLKSLFSSAKSPEVKTEVKAPVATSEPQKAKPKSTARVATVKKKVNGSGKK